MSNNASLLTKATPFVLLLLILYFGGLLYTDVKFANILESKPDLKNRVFILSSDFRKGMIYRGESKPIENEVNPILKVYKGDTVTVELHNPHGFSHDLVISGFDRRTGPIVPGDTKIIQFHADRVGTFDYYCSIADHREDKMEGKLVVRPR